MNKLCIFVGMFVVSTAFWYLGAFLGLEFFGCFLLSSLGAFVGVYAGWKVGQRFS